MIRTISAAERLQSSDAPELAIEFLDSQHAESQLWAGAVRKFVIETLLESGCSTNVAASVWTLATTDTGSPGDGARNRISPQWHHVVACVRAFAIEALRKEAVITRADTEHLGWSLPDKLREHEGDLRPTLWTTATTDAGPSGDYARQRIEAVTKVRIRITDRARAKRA